MSYENVYKVEAMFYILALSSPDTDPFFILLSKAPLSVLLCLI